MNKKHNKGIALVDMIIVIALLALILPLIYQLYTFGKESFTYTNKLIAQQYTVTDVMQHIRGNVQEAALVATRAEYMDSSDTYPKVCTLQLGYSDGSPTIVRYTYWRFYCANAGDEGLLQYSGDQTNSDINAISDFSDVVTGLDITQCKFSCIGDKDKLIVEIKPIETNEGKAQGKNVREKITTEISVSDKYDGDYLSGGVT